MQRSVGGVRIAVGAYGRLTEAYQSGSGKLRFPRGAGVNAGAVEAMVLNASGGLAGGDRFALAASVAAGVLTVSTAACERVYRADGGPARVAQTLTVAAGAALHFLPQPTILYECAGLVRRTRIEAAEGARLVFVEGLVLGREAMGETVSSVALSDRVELVIGGRLAVVDALRLDAGALRRAAEPAGLGGARGIGLVLALGIPDAVERMRTAFAGTHAGASLVGTVAVGRILAPTHTALQDGLARAVEALGALVPRAWTL